MPTLPAGLPLFVQADEPFSVETGLGLVTHGVSGSGSFGGVNLFLACESGVGNVRGGGLNLTLLGASTAEQTGVLSLFTAGANHYAADVVPLTVWNEQTIAESGLPLYVRGSGVEDGSIPFGAGLNLYLQRNPAASLPLYIFAPTSVPGTGVPLYVKGAIPETGSVPLYTHGVGYAPKSTTLFTHGF